MVICAVIVDYDDIAYGVALITTWIVYGHTLFRITVDRR
jgi:hypothetical protein